MGLNDGDDDAVVSYLHTLYTSIITCILLNYTGRRFVLSCHDTWSAMLFFFLVLTPQSLVFQESFYEKTFHRDTITSERVYVSNVRTQEPNWQTCGPFSYPNQNSNYLEGRDITQWIFQNSVSLYLRVSKEDISHISKRESFPLWAIASISFSLFPQRHFISTVDFLYFHLLLSLASCNTLLLMYVWSARLCVGQYTCRSIHSTRHITVSKLIEILFLKMEGFDRRKLFRSVLMTGGRTSMKKQQNTV